jgi:hypothetical protein
MDARGVGVVKTMTDYNIGIRDSSETTLEVEKEQQLSGQTSRRLQRGPILPLIVFLVAGSVYLSVYRHSESIPTAVGANLVPAERVMKGEVPYLDFYKIQAPGILLINAAVFSLFGTRLLTALTAVLVFKVLTIVIVFICARFVSDWKLALVASLLSLFWVAPGGPFRSAPVQFEMFFILSAIWLTLRWMSDRRPVNIFLAGLAVGMVAVLKQNVGVYCAVALAGSVILNSRGLPRSLKEAAELFRNSLRSDLLSKAAGALGIALPLAAMAIYLAMKGALGAAIKVFLKGPGEHLQTRFTGYPIPKPAVAIFGAIVLAVLITRWLVAKYPRSRGLVITTLMLGGAVGAFLVSEDAVNNSIYWFAPALFGFAMWMYYRGKDSSDDYAPGGIDRAILLTLLLFSMAAYGEVFPRSVRGLVIDTMPPAFVLLAFLCRREQEYDREGWPEGPRNAGQWHGERKVVFGLLAVVLLIFAARTIGPTFFVIGGRGLSLRADTEIKFDRGRGVYLPAKRARRVSAAVELIRSRVEPGGYVFAHSLDATSYYFLADRKTPTGATLWNDAGTDDAERARTVAALRDKQVRLVLTSDRALTVERYRPLLDMLATEFHEVDRIGQMVFLERND